jgi:hypothetical protein
VIVLGITDTHGVVNRDIQLLERRLQAQGLVHASGKHHHGALVEYHLQLESEVADGFQHHLFIRLPGGDDAPAHGDAFDAAPFQLLDEAFGRRVDQRSFLACRRPVEQRAVLGHDQLEKLQVVAYLEEIRYFPSGDHDQSPARRAQLFQGSDRGFIQLSVVGDGAVVIGAQGEVTHGMQSDGPGTGGMSDGKQTWRRTKPRAADAAAILVGQSSPMPRS